jgi:hypothetical protein
MAVLPKHSTALKSDVGQSPKKEITSGVEYKNGFKQNM